MVTTEKTPHKKNNGIKDFASFQQLDPLAQLYFFRVLNPLVGLVHTLSHDSISEPQLYRGLKPADADILGKFYTELGTEPEFLGARQRKHIFDSIFGTPCDHEENDCSSFQPLRESLLDACANYAENIRLRDNRDILNAEVETARIPFLNYLLGLQGGSIEWSLARLTDVTTLAAYPILQNDTVAIANRVPEAPQPPWPFMPDPNGNVLVEQISKNLITRGCFGLLQQVAVRGALAIDDVIGCSGQATDIDELIINCNSWYSALKSLRNSDCNMRCY